MSHLVWENSQDMHPENQVRFNFPANGQTEAKVLLYFLIRGHTDQD